ncbi:MAG: DUF4939 domain-containing protein, partial [Cetobacterium sp.]
MNPAEVSGLQAAFAYQSELLKGYQEQLAKLQSVNEHLTHYIRSLPPPTPRTVSFALPDKFNGSAEHCRGFLRQVGIYLNHQGEKFMSETDKCAFLMTLLTGKAIDWAAAVWDTDPQLRTSIDYFIKQLREVFEYPAGGKSITTQLLHATQGTRTAADYAVEFRTFAAQSGFNDVSLKAVFQQGLNHELQAELACKGEDLSFTDYVTLTIKIDNLMKQAPKRKIYKKAPSESTLPTPSTQTLEFTDNHEPMQLGRTKLSTEERIRRHQFQLCFYCGEANHRSSGCPHKHQPTQTVNIDHYFLLTNKSLLLPITLENDTATLEFTAMIDSGAAL